MPASVQSHERPRILVLGGGFGGLWAVRALKGLNADITLVDRHNYHLFQPLLYEVATAGLATVLWAAGVTSSPLGRQLGAPIDRAGRVGVLPDLSVPGHPEINVIGDLASVRNGDAEPAQMVPGVAPAAKQMGAYVGRAIRASIEGRGPLGSFRYRDYGTLATIGRRAAVVQLPFTRLSGAVAWWFWVFAHLVYLIGFRNRLVVLIDWAWAYVSYQRAARIVISADRPESIAESAVKGGNG